MWKPPVAIFLQDHEAATVVPQIAAETGFHSIVVPWYECLVHNGTMVRTGYKVDADGRRYLLPSPMFVSPALIVVLASSTEALTRGRELSLSCNVLVSNYDLIKGKAKVHSGEYFLISNSQAHSEWLAYGVLEFNPASTPLRLVTESLVLSASNPATAADGCNEIDESDSRNLEQSVRVAFESALAASASNAEVVTDPLTHRILAPCALVKKRGEAPELVDSLTYRFSPSEHNKFWLNSIKSWLETAMERLALPAPVEIPQWDVAVQGVGSESSDEARQTGAHLKISAEFFPNLFETNQYIYTEWVPDATFVYLDSSLELTNSEEPASIAALHTTLCRRRSTMASPTNSAEMRLVEPGVGRACLVQNVRLRFNPEFHDYTVLGIGLTPFSEGGYVEIGRTIDGKASLVRALHRKSVAEQLEANGCRSGRVAAIIGLPGDLIEMPDGSGSPAALVLRGFRSAYRVKQLDPLICCLHSLQHTPLVYAFVASRIRENYFADGAVEGLVYDEELAAALETQGASQEWLRYCVNRKLKPISLSNWEELIHRVRWEVIEGYAPVLLRSVKQRLAIELGVSWETIRDLDYIEWFAQSLGAQLSAWRKLRFLHDYHHPGVSRWHPSHLYTLGENNVTLLAEFPDLDTGLFVDTSDEQLDSHIQLGADDAAILRENFTLFHQRDVKAAETVVSTLTNLVSLGNQRNVKSAIDCFRESYAA